SNRGWCERPQSPGSLHARTDDIHSFRSGVTHPQEEEEQEEEQG
mgnify:CR=1